MYNFSSFTMADFLLRLTTVIVELWLLNIVTLPPILTLLLRVAAPGVELFPVSNVYTFLLQIDQFSNLKNLMFNEHQNMLTIFIYESFSYTHQSVQSLHMFTTWDLK